MAIGYGTYEVFFAPKGDKDSGSFFPEVLKEDEHLMYFFAFNARQPVCWNVTSAYNTKHDSMRFYLDIVDPASGKTKTKLQLTPYIGTFSSSDAIVSYSQVKLIGDFVWMVGKETLEGRDPLTGEIKVSGESLTKKFPELKSGIGEAEYYWWGNSIKLTTKDGFVFYYLPAFDELMTEKQTEESRYGKEKETKINVVGYSFTDGIRRELYRVSTTQSKYDGTTDFSSQVDHFIRYADHFKRVYKNYKVEKMEDGRVFINGLVMAGDSSLVVIAYQKEASDDSPVLIEGIGLNGSKWITSDTSLNCLKEAVKSGYIETASLKNNKILLKSYQKCCLGINAGNGRLEWNYVPPN